ncbi:hypothetical protein J4471_03695 [Candidatus Woesearchaeota archaeon]|nr:hypothetical protein [Candidatus Woesearchaeota archaeon]
MQEIDKLFDLREKSIEDDLIVEDLTQKILQLLQKHQPNLHVDYVIESLTKLGFAPNILYDDNGHFAIVESYLQSLSNKSPENQYLAFQIQKDDWKNSIRTALTSYIFDILKGS